MFEKFLYTKYDFEYKNSAVKFHKFFIQNLMNQNFKYFEKFL